MFDRHSPYTPREHIDSVRAIQLVRAMNDGVVEPLVIETFLTLAERLRSRIMEQFNQSHLVYHLTEM